jgi:hypothetical protein
MSGKHFFATKADMEPGLRAFEAKWKSKYIETGFRPTPDVEIYYSAFDLPNLGFSIGHSVLVSSEYLVFPVEADVAVRPVQQHNGQVLYLVEGEQNPIAFLYRPGGWYEDRVLIGGDMGTLSRSEDVLAYYRPFARALTKGFTVLPDVLNYKWWVGPEALILLDAGVRLVTRDLHAPDTYEDLKRS